MYNVTVTWRASNGNKQAVYTPIKEYEVEGAVLTLALDTNHDLVIPLWDVETVDIQRQE
jgi:hypothetical protein